MNLSLGVNTTYSFKDLLQMQDIHQYIINFIFIINNNIYIYNL
jgi:hypothetical protein